MNLEDIVCDFEYAEKLKDLGVIKKSIFFYGFRHKDIKTPQDCRHDNELPTYTVAELGEMLANEHIDNYLYCDLFTEKEEHFYSCGYEGTVVCRDKKEANARAKLLIWLIENNHVNVEELNK